MPMRRMGRPGLIGTAARTAVIAGTAQATMGAVANRQAQRQAEKQAGAEQANAPQQVPPQQPAPPPPPAPAAGSTMLAELEKLAQLHSAGVLTDAEFAAAKAKLLS